MSGATVGLAVAAAYAAAATNAVKACGTLVKVESHQFLEILKKQDCPLVVTTSGGIFSSSIKYLTSYKGLAFHCKSQAELRLPNNVELIRAKKFSMPDI